MAIDTEEQFIELVKKAESEAHDNPGLYKSKLAVYALLGYLVIFGILFSLILMLGGTVAAAFFSSALFLLLLKKKLIFVLLLAVWVLLKALWVKIESPQGYTLTRAKFPALFDELDKLQKKLKTPAIHQVLLTPELNAAISQTPRLGILGWQKNTLILGLQLLLTLSPQEMRSVLAHELGHLSGNHSKFSAWIYRVRLIWHRVMVAFQDSESFGARIMRSFFNWYVPKFEAYSFALARSNEYDADAISAELTSPEVATKALVNVYATSPYVEEKYWQSYFEKADRLPEPDHKPYVGLASFLAANPIAKDEQIQRIQGAMGVETSYDDTHPSLKDRVEAIGAKPVLPEPQKQSAAQALLGDQYHAVISDFDDEWLRDNREGWSNRYQYVTESKAKLHELEQKNLDELSDDELWSRAGWTLEFKESIEALGLYRSIQGRHPADPYAAYWIGRILYEKGDGQCIPEFEKAVHEPELTISRGQMAYYHLLDQGNEPEANKWLEKANKQIAINNQAEYERNSVDLHDDFVAPDMQSEAIKEIKDVLLRHPKVGKAWLARKVVTHYPEKPVYVIAFNPKGISFSYDRILEDVGASFSHLQEDIFVVVKAGDYKKLAKRVIKSGKRIC